MNLDLLVIQIYGDRKTGYAGSLENGGDVTARPNLKHCPFCGGYHDDLEITNTHTAYYSVRCNSCGCEITPGHPEGYNGERIRTKKAALKIHHAAIEKAIRCWNTRYSAS